MSMKKQVINFIKHPRIMDIHNTQYLQKDDTLDLSIELDMGFYGSKHINVKIIILKEVLMKDSVLVFSWFNNIDIKHINAQAALLGYQSCYRYNRKELDLAICIEKF